MTKNLLITALTAALAASWGFIVIRERNSPFRKNGPHAWIVTPAKDDWFEFQVAGKQSFDVTFSDKGFSIDTLKFRDSPSFQGYFRFSGSQSFSFFHHQEGSSYFDSDGDGLTDKKALIPTREFFTMQQPVWVPKKKEPNQSLQPTPTSVTSAADAAAAPAAGAAEQ